MTVGELSRHTGVPVKALREYTDLGLIYTLGRSAANYRLFTADALWCVRWIGQLRDLGLTVAEIRQLTTAYLDGQPFGPALAKHLRTARKRLQARITAAEQTLDRIDAFENSHQAELADHGGNCWADDSLCGMRA
ncbi:MerR family transcriptional regulator [Streptomyces sp. ISL-22]|uniref:MerR family transcriptional regulator n=1 Tax=unclassified Streptomyces TaxID=2593676 RepID=UPI001BE9F63C|nr:MULTISPECIES: MerR family transcriptional regulator [unclassified Streptomyces]MBT2419387.1 MerR family transcriptional regulator [Streptomyces sp. ISL-24]MBT2436883.1 MerR family transcriptional regulator [Streptomyces sp. ISL-22]